MVVVAIMKIMMMTGIVQTLLASQRSRGLLAHSPLSGVPLDGSPPASGAFVLSVRGKGYSSGSSSSLQATY